MLLYPVSIILPFPSLRRYCACTNDFIMKYEKWILRLSEQFQLNQTLKDNVNRAKKEVKCWSRWPMSSTQKRQRQHQTLLPIPQKHIPSFQIEFYLCVLCLRNFISFMCIFICHLSSPKLIRVCSFASLPRPSFKQADDFLWRTHMLVTVAFAHC